MSYEGFHEFLCSAGHYFTCDCNDDHPKECPVCLGNIVVWHSVDSTNGQTDHPSTRRAAKSIIGQEEYTATRYLYAPIANWRVR